MKTLNLTDYLNLYAPPGRKIKPKVSSNERRQKAARHVEVYMNVARPGKLKLLAKIDPGRANHHDYTKKNYPNAGDSTNNHH